MDDNFDSTETYAMCDIKEDANCRMKLPPKPTDYKPEVKECVICADDSEACEISKECPSWNMPIYTNRVVNRNRFHLYQAMESLLGNKMLFVKLENKGNYGIYVAEVPCDLADQKKYIFIIVYGDNIPPGNGMYLKDLRYESIQFKTLRSSVININVPIQQISGKPDTVLKSKMKKMKDNDTSILFASEPYNLKIEYLSPKKGFIYSNDIPIINCINSFNCNIEFMK